MFELIFCNGRSIQYRKSDQFTSDFEQLLNLLDSLNIDFALYLNFRQIDYPVDLRKICQYVC